MRDFRDLLSGPLHIERIVFAYDITHVRHEPVFREEKRTHYYLGATSNDRFLLVEIPSPETASQPVDLLKLERPTAVARSSDTDFYYNGPLITPQPRAASGSNLENTFRARLHPLMYCLQFGLAAIKPGSIHWDGDRFNAEFKDEMKNQGTGFSLSFGKNVPESVKEKHLAELQNPPPNQETKLLNTTVKLRAMQSLSVGGKVIWSGDGNLQPTEIPIPAPGSVEARIVAHHRAQHEARMANSINGQLLRDTQKNVTEIRLDMGLKAPWRIELDYAPSADLPLPFPHRIRMFNNSSEPDAAVPSHQITIYAARISDQPLDDATFVLWPHLKEGSYVRGKMLPNGRFTIADPKDQKLLHELLHLQHLPPT
jgi:hypothetical protein